MINVETLSWLIMRNIMHESILDNNVAMMVATVADRHDTVDD